MRVDVHREGRSMRGRARRRLGTYERISELYGWPHTFINR